MKKPIVLSRMQRKRLLELTHAGTPVREALEEVHGTQMQFHATLLQDAEFQEQYDLACVLAAEDAMRDKDISRNTPVRATMELLTNLSPTRWMSPAVRASVAREMAKRTAGGLGGSGVPIRRVKFGKNPLTNKWDYIIPGPGRDRLGTDAQFVSTDQPLPDLEPWPGTQGVTVADETQPAAAEPAPEAPAAEAPAAGEHAE